MRKIISVTGLSPAVAVYFSEEAGPPSGFRWIYIAEEEPLIADYLLARNLQSGKKYEVETSSWWTRIPPYTRVKTIIREL